MAVAIRLGFETIDITTYFYTFVENLQVANIASNAIFTLQSIEKYSKSNSLCDTWHVK